MRSRIVSPLRPGITRQSVSTREKVSEKPVAGIGFEEEPAVRLSGPPANPLCANRLACCGWLPACRP